MGMQRRGMNPIAVALAIAALAACSPQVGADSGQSAPNVDAASDVHPISGLKVIPVTVETDDGSHVFRTEVAQTGAEQAKGLMFRTELGPDEGMIFPRKGDVASFWMKNTPLPLDIIFIGKDRRILNIAAQTTPYSLDSVSAVGPTSAVFEIPGGRAAELAIEAGDRVDW